MKAVCWSCEMKAVCRSCEMKVVGWRFNLGLPSIALQCCPQVFHAVDKKLEPVLASLAELVVVSGAVVAWIEAVQWDYMLPFVTRPLQRL